MISTIAANIRQCLITNIHIQWRCEHISNPEQSIKKLLKTTTPPMLNPFYIFLGVKNCIKAMTLISMKAAK